MAFDTVVLDERTLTRGSEAQRVDWDASIREFVAKANGGVDYDATLHVAVTEQHFAIEAIDSNGAVVHSTKVSHDLLADHITEYVDIVRQIADADGINQMEALDMAKKVTHDRVARVLKRELREFGFDHETARKLFTLLLSLRVDITRLVGIHGHRTVR